MKERLTPNAEKEPPSGGPYVTLYAAGSVRQFTLDHNPVHSALDRKIIVESGGVQRTSIIPDDHIVQAPLVRILKLGLRGVIEQLVEEDLSVLFRHAFNRFRADRVEVDRLFSRRGMGANDRVASAPADRFFFRRAVGILRGEYLLS